MHVWSIHYIYIIINDVSAFKQPPYRHQYERCWTKWMYGPVRLVYMTMQHLFPCCNFNIPHFTYIKPFTIIYYINELCAIDIAPANF